MKRADIKTGFICNNNCLFCVQAHKKKLGNKDTKTIKSELKQSKESGCDAVVFTGGEVTIRNDFFELLAYAKQLGYKHIQVQSNGRMLSYQDFCHRAIESGMTEFSPAIHGHKKELHDYLTRSKGSFEQTIKAIKLVKQKDMTIITNTVVVKPNYRYLEMIAELLVDLKVDQFQFAFMHAVGNAEKYFDKMMPRVSLAAPFIHKGLQIGIDAGIKVMAEAMPFCTMKGYEKYVSELYIPKTEIRDFNEYDPDFDDTRKNKGKIKFEKCRLCKYDLICEGPWREYPKKYGNEEFQPIKSKKIESSEEIIND